jgi:hypothetical protein
MATSPGAGGASADADATDSVAELPLLSRPPLLPELSRLSDCFFCGIPQNGQKSASAPVSIPQSWQSILFSEVFSKMLAYLSIFI